MFSDSINLGTTPIAYVRTQHTALNQRAKWSPSGDLLGTARGMEISHEVTRAKRQNSLIKVTKNITDAITGVVSEISFQVKVSIPPTATAAEIEALRDHGVSFLTNANLVKITGRES